MNKIKIIIKREYLTRVRKKSFIVMTILGPILLCALCVVPVLLQEAEQSRTEIIVVDNTAELVNDKSLSLFKDKFNSNNDVAFVYMDNIETAQRLLKENSCDGVLEIVKTNDTPPIKSFMYYGENEPGIKVQEEIKNQLVNILKDNILRYDYGMSNKEIDWINNPKVDFYTKNILTGESSFNEIKTALGGIAGFLIYFFILIFASMMMKSVSEEKVNRIVEVLVSSVKPIQLLLGKLFAIALVGLTQFAMWVVLTFILISAAQVAIPDLFTTPTQEEIMINERVISVDTINAVENGSTNEIIQGLMAINYPLIIVMFLFFFLTGYMLYASIFGAIGSLIDTDTDGQQFILPATIPIIIAIVAMPVVIENPAGSIAFWLSIIPFTSPIIMMIRIPFGVPIWELGLSVILMLIAIAFCIWIAAKIYRTAILLYGKRISYKEIWKWLRYKN
ncbi:MAG: ABC transporter permease [Bacteroidales bacterium]|jgi:ABC-2 type transport system permease protein|nr:ABC transporter permease [Bacteroidales bacterium]